MNFIIFSLFFLLSGIYFFWLRKNKMNKIDKLLSSKSLNINELSSHKHKNSVELYAKVVTDSPLLAPLSNLQCSFYKMQLIMNVDEKESFTNQSGERATRWVNKTKTIFETEKDTTFYLEDETGKIRADIQGAELTPEHSYSSIDKNDLFEIPSSLLNGGNEITKELAKLKEDISKIDQDTMKIVNFNWIEYTLPMDRNVYILGSVEKTNEGLVLKKVGGNPFLISIKAPGKVYEDLDKKVQLLFYIGIGSILLSGILFFYGIKELM